MKYFVAALVVLCSLVVFVFASEGTSAFYIPSHISEGAKDFLKTRKKVEPTELTYQELRDIYISALKLRLAAAKERGITFSEQAVTIADVQSHWISAPGVDPKSPRILLHMHGGGYFAGNAALMADLPAKISALTQLPVLTVEYNLAPEHPWPSGLNQVVAVYEALLAQGYKAENIGLSGESAGSGMALSAVQVMMRKNLPLPALVYAISPWTDLALEGDSYGTLNGDDPFFLPAGSIGAAYMYAGFKDKKHPEISPLYGEFKNHPPLFIQSGTKEILLSDSIRLAHVARKTGTPVVLDLWDGMWHVFQDYDASVPEAMEALTRAGRFINKYLPQ